MPSDPKSEILSFALDQGFNTGGIAPARMGEREQNRLTAFVANREYGEMSWMAETLERRRSPQGLWPEARSVIVLGTNYGPEEDPLSLLEQSDQPVISCYAQNRDYHDLIKKRLKRVARWMVEQFDCDVKVFVDTAPVLEKPLAAMAGVGWQGKHSNLVSREFGSWLFLGEIYTTLELSPDTAQEDHCGGCRRCLEICPTDAFPTPYQLDARRCISYLTIEHRGPIPVEFRKPMGNRIYGCDDCLAVCPWNKFAVPTEEPWFLPRDVVAQSKLSDFLALDDASFRSAFSGSPVKRIGIVRFLRNVLIASGNSGDPALVAPVLALLTHVDPTVRGAAVWALATLNPEHFRQARGTYRAKEEDTAVLAEWDRTGT